MVGAHSHFRCIPLTKASHRASSELRDEGKGTSASSREELKSHIAKGADIGKHWGHFSNQFTLSLLPSFFQSILTFIHTYILPSIHTHDWIPAIEQDQASWWRYGWKMFM